MKLSSFPFVIQKEILDHLSINNILFLSLCSKNTKEFIMQMEKYQFQKIKRIDFQIDGKNKFKCVHIGSKAIMWLFRTKNAPKGFLKGFEKVRVKELGIDFFRASDHLTGLHAKYCSGSLETIIKTIHGHLSELFGTPTKFWLFSEGKSLYFPILSNIQKVEIFAGKRLEPAKIDRFLSQSTCLECFEWYTLGRQEIELKEKTKIYQLDTVRLKTRHSLANDVLENFNGRQAFLKGDKITTTDAIQFLNSWKEGEKYQNLEVISVDSLNFNIPEIRNSVEFKEVNTRVLYAFIRRFERRYSFIRADGELEDPWEFRSQFYMVRKSDGHVASVLLADDRILMGVWKMTEKQFLEKFQQTI